MLRRYLLLFCFTFLIYVALDAIWLFSLAKPYYIDGLGDFLRIPEETTLLIWASAFTAYTLMILGILVFVLPKGKKRYLNTFLWGVLYGGIIYGVYQTTNFAILSGWPLNVALLDTFWGMTVSGISSLCACRLYKAYF